MRRRNMHVVFAAIALACAVVAGLQYRAIDKAGALNKAFGEAQAHAMDGEIDLAEPLLVELIASSETSTVAVASRFELGNAYLREALRQDLDERRRRPLAELAKERYRELLRVAPEHWDARHNLELALRLAPERVADDVDDERDPIKRVDVVVPDFQARDRP